MYSSNNSNVFKTEIHLKIVWNCEKIGRNMIYHHSPPWSSKATKVFIPASFDFKLVKKKKKKTHQYSYRIFKILPHHSFRNHFHFQFFWQYYQNNICSTNNMYALKKKNLSLPPRIVKSCALCFPKIHLSLGWLLTAKIPIHSTGDPLGRPPSWIKTRIFWLFVSWN